MAETSTSSIFFNKDEMNLMQVNKNWSQEELLSKDGIFFLKDVVKILNLDAVKVRKKALELKEENQANGVPLSWQVMGIRKIWNHWIIRMKVFASYYRKYLYPRIQMIPEDCNANDLLKQKGLYYLADVCKHIPFKADQLRYRAKRNPRAKEEYGIWKDATEDAYVVKMEIFGDWIRRLWTGSFEG